MARDIPIGNGNLLVAFDAAYQIRDWYFPLVGQENHTAGHPFRLGVFYDGRFSWVDSADWTRTLGYEDHTMATAVTLTHSEWGLTLYVTDVVDYHENILIRRFRWHNTSDQETSLQIFFSHDFHIYGVDVGDTAFYDPMTRSVVHYKGQRYFLMSGQVGDRVGVEQWATGRKEVAGMEGTWRDAEDGQLESNAIAQGSVDSTYGLSLTLGPNQEDVLYAWVCAGQSLEEVRHLNGLIAFESPLALIDRTRAFWRLWLDKGEPTLPTSMAEFRSLYERSLVVLRTNIDNRGGIVAANDSDIMHHSRDTYSYVWPRDGAWVARALDIAGYPSLSARFFAFCADVLEPGGYFLHKYNPDRSLASSWHPWWLDGRPELPIQEDETGIVLWALWQHFVQWRDVEMVEPWLRRLVFEAGQFLADYRHPDLKLPWPSWDLWEERRGIHAYTVACVHAGITAAGHFAEAFGEAERARDFYDAADETRQAFWRYLVNPRENRFWRRMMVSVDRPDHWEPDPVADASLLLLPQLGIVAPDHPVMVNTARWVRNRLWVPTAIGGLARYEGDFYQREGLDPDVPGNPWFISTLWYADYLIMRAGSPEDLAQAAALIHWVADNALNSGVLAEQLHPHSGLPLSVSPLTWSHAALVMTIDRYRQAALKFEAPTAQGDRSRLRTIGY